MGVAQAEMLVWHFSSCYAVPGQRLLPLDTGVWNPLWTFSTLFLFHQYYESIGNVFRHSSLQYSVVFSLSVILI